jgi:hypothetical protein
MKTETKIDRIKDFLSDGKNELFRVDNNPLTLSILFDIDFSNDRKKIGFSKCLKVKNIDEVIYIIEKLAKNISKDQIIEKVYQKFNQNFLDRDKSFYLIMKGNRLKRKLKSGL